MSFASDSSLPQTTQETSWWVYILECVDGTLYTGIARDPTQRLAQHRAGTGAKYTKSHPPKALRYQEHCDSRSAALKREVVIKSLTRPQKLQLISQSSGASGNALH